MLPAPLAAQVPAIPPGWTLSGSLAPSYTDNAAGTRTNPIDDRVHGSDLTLTYSGRTASGLYYEAYVRGAAEWYARLSPLDNSAAGFGGTLSQVLADGSVVGVKADPKLFYRDFFAIRTLNVFDHSAYWTRSFALSDTLAVTPRLTAAKRWGENPAADRFWVDARVIVNKKLPFGWSVRSITVLQHAWFQFGLPPARDILFTQSLGLSYELPRFAQNVIVIVGVGGSFTARWSNRLAREFKQWNVGPRFDATLLF